MKNTFYIPIFQGFYESIHSWQLDSIEEMEIENIAEDSGVEDYDYDNFTDDYDVDYREMYVEYAKSFADNFKDEFAERLKASTWILIWNYWELYSPQFYNYETDKIFVNCDVDIDKLKEYVNTNEFSDYILEHNRSRDGFFSYMETNIEDYIDLIDSDCPSNIITQVVEFFIEQEGDDNILWDLCEDIDCYGIFLNNVKEIKK